MAHHWKIRKNRAQEYVAYFCYNDEVIFWTEGYSSKASARNAIDSMRKNGPGAETEDETTDVLQEDELQKFRDAAVPASDRVVSPDHNSKEFREYEKAYRKLSETLRTSNDLREFDSDELALARVEIGQIDDIARRSIFRPEYLWNLGKSALLFIAEKAADGIIKALAVAVLVAIAKLIGLTLL